MSTPMAIDHAETDFTSFDLEGYISEYTSRTRIERLLFIAEKSINQQLELDAYKLAADLLKEGTDVAKYSEVMANIGGRLGPDYMLDEAWIEKVQNNCHRRREEIESQLHGYKTNMMREGIRMGHTDLAVFYRDCGQLQEALKEYSKTRDYCTHAKHSAMLCLNTMRVAWEMRTLAHLTASLRKVAQLPAEAKTKVFMAQTNCYHGLKELEVKKYETAASYFIQVDPELGKSFNDVMTLQDVALYGGICALATFSRAELKTKVISSIVFKEVLGNHSDIRNCIHDFYRSRYSSCFSRLKNLKPSLMLDIHLHAHVEELYNRIRQRALVQFTGPFTSVSLHSMSVAFNVSIKELQKEIVQLISANKISARIDAENQILYTQHGNARRESFAQVESLTRNFLQENKALLVRLSLIKHDIMQKQMIPSERQSKKSYQLDLSSEPML